MSSLLDRRKATQRRALTKQRGRLRRLRALRAEIAKAAKNIAARRGLIRGNDGPRIVASGITGPSLFGPLGTPTYVTGHHTAGPVDQSLNHALSLCRSFSAQHANQGWGKIGYHFCLARTGEIILLRPIGEKGAHVGGFNTGNVGVMCHGTTGDRPTEAQAAAFRWLRANAHTSAMPASHRSPRDLRNCALRGHNDWPGHTSNACPGTHKTLYKSGGSSR